MSFHFFSCSFDSILMIFLLVSGVINNSNYGWLLDVRSNTDVDTVPAGISVIF